MEIKPAQAARFLKEPPGDLRAVLLYGPDSGLVEERSRALVAAVLDDPADPFRLSDLTVAQVKDDPARLFDEAASLVLTGGRRVVRLRGGGEAVTNLLKRFLAEPPAEALVIVEAGEIAKRSALVRLFEGGGDVAALACYRDSGRDLERVIGESLAEDGVRAAPDALAYLTANLGGDRQLTRRELEKLRLYHYGNMSEITLPEVAGLVGDSAALSLDDLCFAVAGGDLAAVDRALRRSLQEGANPVQILRSVARHFQRLHYVAGASSAGGDVEAGLRKLRPPVFWKQKDRFVGQVRSWPAAWLARALERLLLAEADCKRTGAPDAAICGAVLLQLAAGAPRAGGRARFR